MAVDNNAEAEKAEIFKAIATQNGNDLDECRAELAAQSTELARLKRDLNAAMPQPCCQEFDSCDSAQCVPKLNHQLARLRKAVEKYGQHLYDCESRNHSDCFCTCGFSEIQPAVKAEEGKS